MWRKNVNNNNNYNGTYAYAHFRHFQTLIVVKNASKGDKTLIWHICNFHHLQLPTADSLAAYFRLHLWKKTQIETTRNIERSLLWLICTSSLQVRACGAFYNACFPNTCIISHIWRLPLDQVFTVSRILQLSRDAGVNRLRRNTSSLGDFPRGDVSHESRRF